MRNLSILVAILLFALLIGCNEKSNSPVQSTDQNGITSLAKSGSEGPSASGQGGVIFVGGSHRIFTFHAVTHPDGSVSGQGMIKYVSSDPNQRIQAHFDINCINVIDNVAVISGIITRIVRNNIDDSADPYAEGQYIQFKVVDNGEGANADPDQISWFNHGLEVPPCDQEDVTYPLFDIEEGNIQIKP